MKLYQYMADRGSTYSLPNTDSHMISLWLTHALVSPGHIQTRSLLLTQECLRSRCWMSSKECKPQVHNNNSIRAAYHLISSVKATLKLHCREGELMCHPATADWSRGVQSCWFAHLLFVTDMDTAA